MDRYMRIQSLTFDQTDLPLPLSVRLCRSAPSKLIGSDKDFFATSLQLDQPNLSAEVRIRGTAAAEALTLGQQGTLSFTVLPTSSGANGRTITLSGAILTAIDISYEQNSSAVAILRFETEAADGTVDPFSAEDQA